MVGWRSGRLEVIGQEMIRLEGGHGGVDRSQLIPDGQIDILVPNLHYHTPHDGRIHLGLHLQGRLRSDHLGQQRAHALLLRVVQGLEGGHHGRRFPSGAGRELEKGFEDVWEGAETTALLEGREQTHGDGVALELGGRRVKECELVGGLLGGVLEEGVKGGGHRDEALEGFYICFDFHASFRGLQEGSVGRIITKNIVWRWIEVMGEGRGRARWRGG